MTYEIMTANDGSGFAIWNQGQTYSVVERREGESKLQAFDRAAAILKVQNDANIMAKRKKIDA